MSKDEADISEALCNWFESQEIRPSLAIMSMTSLLGIMIGQVSRSEIDAVDGAILACQEMTKTALTTYKLKGGTK
jgi:hypothetical protein